ncbi:uroporphyrinogen-III synthase [Phocicoccus pinnipedialis]|uniref:Uroporphyrinogen-III synthase n=2 Tax=Phocicoccus pinnipedialis TaxID=110845 RepID=A0A6V7RE59_9BACL|nr:uroporphyrinogen-III synthase [Jeotgalicoccus pinnipedialis]MBP1939447.1 uroporphyrinogen-III synthase [Jeotgalicoccus pinnipedialis]CAD2075378.1 uroporphyrinogen-III synthase [Jeotgalicoccus pinnipedialis]
MKTNKKLKKVIVTQSHFNHKEADLDILHFPIISFEQLDFDKNKLNRTFDWVVITSKNTVTFFKDYLDQINYKNIASIGKTTTKALVEAGFKVDFEPSTYTQEGFMQEFNVDKDMCILYPASNEKRPLMRNFMVKHDAEVVEIDLYHPIGNKLSLEGIRNNLYEIDAITFSSPSGVHVFMQHFDKQDLEGITVATIGHVTRSALEAYGVLSIMPEQATLNSMIEMLEKELNE